MGVKPGCRSVAQPGSASGLGPEGREFESLHSDQPFPLYFTVTYARHHRLAPKPLETQCHYFATVVWSLIWPLFLSNTASGKPKLPLKGLKLSNLSLKTTIVGRVTHVCWNTSGVLLIKDWPKPR